ncbi:DUF3575 domain-containing protein [Flavobacteriaceae bacterium MHTCC 0001]
MGLVNLLNPFFIFHAMKLELNTYFYVILVLFALNLSSQTSIKVNITTLVAVPNIGAEFHLGEHTAFQFDIMASFWTIDGVPYKFGVAFPEFRYYTKEAGYGFYFGAHIGGGIFKLQKWNQAVVNSYQEGFTILFGATLGYQFKLSERFNLELFLGGGSQQAQYKGYSLETGERGDGAVGYNKSGEFLPYRGGLMLVYKL